MLAALLAAVLIASLPARAQSLPIETLLARIFSMDNQAPYDVTANFTGTLALDVKDGRWVSATAGTFHEWRERGQPRHWKVTIERLELPALLRPFSTALRRAIEDRAAMQSEGLETLRFHDLFILEERPGGYYVLGGIRHDLVDEAIDRYGHAQDKANPSTRRHIARWLYTSPTTRDWIVRRGVPYALQTVVDDLGLAHTLALYYNWGRLDMTFAYVTVGGHSLWREVSSIVTSEIEGLGHVNGQLTLTFGQHRFAQRP